jgi:hypothetical protein
MDFNTLYAPPKLFSDLSSPMEIDLPGSFGGSLLSHFLSPFSFFSNQMMIDVKVPNTKFNQPDGTYSHKLNLLASPWHRFSAFR